MTRRIHVVGIGGGTGLSVLLAGLGRAAERARESGGPPLDITAIVSVADDGGSTGSLRQELGIPAVGDLRDCLVALSEGDRLWSELFQYRFAGGNGLDGHAVGNLIMAALVQRAGGLSAAVRTLGRPLRLRGQVLPVTDQPVTLCAEVEGGGVVFGESKIPFGGGHVARVWLCPEEPVPAPGVLEAIEAADVVVLGPGSLYTSLVPNLLVDGVAAAIRNTRAVRVFACNLMTQPGETDGYDVAGHLRALERYLGAGAVDLCLVNSRPLAPELTARSAAAGVVPVRWVPPRTALRGAFPVLADLLPDGRFTNRHDPDKLAAAVLSLARVRTTVPQPRPATAAAPAAPPAAAASGRQTPVGVRVPWRARAAAAAAAPTEAA